jgi:hypothetical protein
MTHTVICNRGRAAMRGFLCALVLVGTSQPAKATILDWLGLDVSDSSFYKEVLHWIDPLTGVVVEAVKPNTPPPRVGLITAGVRALVWVIDPPATNLLSGRVTLAFDPSEIVTAAGWYGEFGADPNLPAPAIGADPDIALLQSAANPAMLSSSIVINQANGLAVFEFDWGPQGFVPTKNMDAAGHFNILGLYLAPVPGTSNSHVVFSAADVLANGVNASTYMLCTSPDGDSTGTCGLTAIPEPSTQMLLAPLFVAAALFVYRRRRYVRS